MERFLDIIIPEYNCPETFIKRLLHSISRQKNVDFKEIGVIIVNDKSKNKLRKGIFKNFPKLNIEYYLKDVNEGVGMTRQYGLDRSNAKYVTFIDQDDELYGDDSLSKIFKYLKETDLACVCTDFYEEVKTLDNKIITIRCGKTDGRQTLHGVFIKRQFMFENNIRFIPGFRVHDDYYLRNVIRTIFLPPVCDTPTYLWKYNENSQVRTKYKYSYMVHNFDEYIRVAEKTIDFLKERNAIAGKRIIDIVTGIYVLLNSNLFNYEDLKEVKNEYLYRLYKLMCSYSNELFAMKNEAKKYYDGQIVLAKNSYLDFKIFNDDTIYDFMEKMSKEYPEIELKKYESTQKPKLEIIINYYNNNFNNLERITNSIYNQQNLTITDLKVLYVFEKEKPNYFDSIINREKYPSLNYEIVIHNDDESIHQFGLKNVDSDYFCFLDQFDLMFGPTILYQVLNVIKKDEFDVICTDYYIYVPEKNYKNIIKYGTLRSLNAMFFKYSKIKECGFSFGNNVIYNEAYFNLITTSNCNLYRMDIPTYVWVVNSNSISFATREGINLVLSYTNDYFSYLFDVLDFFGSQKKLCNDTLIKIVYEMYSVIKSGFLNFEIASRYQDKIKDLYGSYFKRIDVKDYNEEIENTKNYVKTIYKIDNTSITFEDFINEIVK